jgi:hypothetical protein
MDIPIMIWMIPVTVMITGEWVMKREETVLTEYALMKLLGLIIQIVMGISIDILNVLVEVFAIERLLNVNVSRGTLGRDAKEPPVPMNVLDMELVNTWKTSHSVLCGESTLLLLTNNK